jgi:hypothetical protein
LYLAWKELRNLLLPPVVETLTLGEISMMHHGDQLAPLWDAAREAMRPSLTVSLLLAIGN